VVKSRWNRIREREKQDTKRADKRIRQQGVISNE